MSCYFKNAAYSKVYVPKFIDSEVVYYEIHVKIQDVEWSLERRYNDFSQLNEKLVLSGLISKKMLPPKKLIGNKNLTFLEQRRKQLESYLQKLLTQFSSTIPSILAEFLDFNKYDIIYVLEDFSKCVQECGKTLSNVKEYSFSALELFAVSECLRLPCLDYFSIVFEFCSQLEVLKGTLIKDTELIECDYNSVDVPIAKSNIFPSKLKFNLIAFRNLKSFTFSGISTENVVDIGLLKPNIKCISVHNTTITRINQVLMCDNINAIDVSPSNCAVWTNIVKLDLSSNLLRTIDSSIKKAPNLCTLILNQNQITCIQNLCELSYLQSLSLSNNSIAECIDWHVQLGNLVTLNLAQNILKRLVGLKKLYSLVNLDLSCNQIQDLDEVDNVACLPMLETLRLTGNPLASTVDYRSRVLARFHARAAEISLDSERGSYKELDTALVLSALNQSQTIKKIAT